MKKIVAVQPIHPKGMEILQAGGRVVIPSGISDEEVIEAARDADALIVRLTKVSASLINAIPSLKVIGRNGVGVDNVDVKTASARGIAVINTPGTNSNSVAEYIISAFMFLHKKLVEFDQCVRKGEWQLRDRYKGVDLQGKTIGIVGLGQIGSIVAQKCIVGLGMRVLVYDPFIPRDYAVQNGAAAVEDLNTLLAESDVVSLNIPFTPETKGLLNSQRLRSMRRGAVLVNASRGGIIDEPALAEVLMDGHLGGAALDVFGEEPPASDNPLWKAPNLLVTPHIAGLTEDAAERTSETMAKDVVAVLRGEKPVNLYNREIFSEV